MSKHEKFCAFDPEKDDWELYIGADEVLFCGDQCDAGSEKGSDSSDGDGRQSLPSNKKFTKNKYSW